VGAESASSYSQTLNGQEVSDAWVIRDGEPRVQSGPFLVSRTGDAGWTERCAKVPKCPLIRYHKRRWYLQTAGRWPWKSESAKECVTTHLPKVLALKMDGAQADHRCATAGASARRRRVGGRGVGDAAVGVSLSETDSGADLGGSSKYSDENFEDWSGERFLVNSSWTRVSRS